MKLILLFLLFALMRSNTEANEPIVVSRLPEFETATEWAQDLQRRYPSFKLIHSSEVKGIWLVLFRTAENNLVWSEKRIGENLGSGSRSIQDLEGNSIVLGDYDSTNDREKPATSKNFRTDFKIFRENGWDVYSRDDGSLIGLVQPAPKEFKLHYTFRPKGGGEVIIFDELIELLPE
jgi:hypothetical protein